MRTTALALFALVLFALGLFAAAASAQQPVAGRQVAPQPPADASGRLGRLFLTPQQRQELDRRRQLNIKETVVADEGTGTVTVDGQVLRSNGQTTTWVNGAPEYDAERPDDPTRVRIQSGESEVNVPVKVGQSIDRARGEVKDALRGGKVTIHQGPVRGR